MAVTRSAKATWRGNLLEGRGTVSSATTMRFNDLPVSWNARTGEPEGLTSPEELLAAAHASCFSMSLASNLIKSGYTAEQLDITATITADKLDAGWTVISSHLAVHGRVPGADQAAFEKAADGAKEGCPISRALKGNVELSVEATLDA
ncbi:MAG TPA: OsmC family peroxiredoxin [Candidatus Limnocylindrales bacterium]